MFFQGSVKTIINIMDDINNVCWNSLIFAYYVVYTVFLITRSKSPNVLGLATEKTWE